MQSALADEIHKIEYLSHRPTEATGLHHSHISYCTNIRQQYAPLFKGGGLADNAERKTSRYVFSDSRAISLPAWRLSTMRQIPTDRRPMQRTPDAARYMGVSKSSLEKYRLTGGGPKYLKLGKTVVYHPDDLDAWLASHRRTSTNKAA
jgi:predicted DNA-binding transcriptional regulator AlpA